MGMWPNCIRICTIGFAVARIDHIHKIHFSITIVVILCKIYTIIHQQTCLFHHLIGLRIVSVLIIFSVIYHFLTHGDRTYHIKMRIILPVRGFVEILTRRTFRFHLNRLFFVNIGVVAHVVLAHQHTIHFRLLCLKCHILEVYQYHQSTWSNVQFSSEALLVTNCSHTFGSNLALTQCFAYAIKTIFCSLQPFASFIGYPMKMLITMLIHSHFRAVWLRFDDSTFACRYSIYTIHHATHT